MTDLTFLAKLNPVALDIGFLTIRWYGVMVASGFMAGMGILHWRAKKNGFPKDHIADVITAAVIGGLIGARIYFVIQYWDQKFAGNLFEIIRIDRGGLVFYGGFIGATLAVIFVCYRKKLPLWKLADMMAVGLPIGQALGRVGCLINGCCYGRVSDSSIAITYPKEGYEGIFEQQLYHGQINEHATACLPVLPTQAFASLMNVAIFVILIVIMPKIKKQGQLFACFLMLYACGRFGLEFFRGDYNDSHYFSSLNLTVAHLTGLLVLPVGAFLFHWQGKWGKDRDFLQPADDND